MIRAAPRVNSAIIVGGPSRGRVKALGAFVATKLRGPAEQSGRRVASWLNSNSRSLSLSLGAPQELVELVKAKKSAQAAVQAPAKK